MAAPRLPSPRPVAVTILAAGLGRRLGGCAKAALVWQGHTLLERQTQTLQALRDSGQLAAQPVHVVIGPYADVMQPLVARCGAVAVPHTLTEPTLADSQRLAVQAHRLNRPGTDLMLLLADLPWLQADDLRCLIQAWAQRARTVHALRPLVTRVNAQADGPGGGAPGHPLLLSRLALRQIHHSPPQLGVRDWLANHRTRLALLPSSNPAYLRDVDTPQDWAALLAGIDQWRDGHA